MKHVLIFIFVFIFGLSSLAQESRGRTKKKYLDESGNRVKAITVSRGKGGGFTGLAPRYVREKKRVYNSSKKTIYLYKERSTFHGTEHKLLSVREHTYENGRIVRKLIKRRINNRKIEKLYRNGVLSEKHITI